MKKKLTPQRKRRLELEDKWQDTKLSVAIRDGFKCVVCGLPAISVNHILSRGAHKELFTDERNLACLCRDHDNSDTNTEPFVRIQFAKMNEKYPGYKWDELPFKFYLEETKNDDPGD